MNSTQSVVDGVPHIMSEHTVLYVVLPLVFLWGLVDCFYGHRFFKISVIFIGSLILGYAGGMLAQHYLTPGTYTFFGGCAVGLAVGIIFSWILYRVETFLLGMIIGGLFAASFFPHVSELQLGITCLGGLVGGVLMLMFMDMMIISATAATGALRIVLCFACFIGAIPMAHVYDLIEGKSLLGAWYQWNLDVRYILAMLVLLLLGFIKQYHHYRKEEKA